MAVDATAARLMTLDPRRLPYLAHAAAFLGNIEPARIALIAERVDRFRQDFRVVPAFRHVKPGSPDDA